jgi:c-di-GMP-related signal transduction protein
MECFIARQPVFNAFRTVFGYELLFRNGLDNFYSFADGDKATLDILATTLFHTPLLEMVSGKVGLVNFTRNLLLSDVIFLFDRDHIIIEVLETVHPDEEVVATCRRLHNSGYRIAMDDFVAADLNHPLINLADIVKVDFTQTLGKERALIAEKLLPRKITLLAEKVESEEDFQEGCKLGYKYFQGYFFSRPVVRTLQRVPPNRMLCLRMLQIIATEEFDFQELNRIVAGDLSLTYRVLRLVNSALFGFRPEITSTSHALMLLGRDHLRRFISVIAASTLSDGKTPELVLTCMIRAKLGEQIACHVGRKGQATEFFLVGLFSIIDALLDRPMEEIMTELPLSQDIRSALLGSKNMLRLALDAITAYESGNWELFSRLAAEVGIGEGAFPANYAVAIRWATDLLDTL